jgi:hypothetical protein
MIFLFAVDNTANKNLDACGRPLPGGNAFIVFRDQRNTTALNGAFNRLRRPLRFLAALSEAGCKKFLSP